MDETDDARLAEKTGETLEEELSRTTILPLLLLPLLEEDDEDEDDHLRGMRSLETMVIPREERDDDEPSKRLQGFPALSPAAPARFSLDIRA